MGLSGGGEVLDAQLSIYMNDHKTRTSRIPEEGGIKTKMGKHCPRLCYLMVLAEICASDLSLRRRLVDEWT